MAKYRKKPVVVDATQWFKNGDHPQDNCHPIDPGNGGEPFVSEGKVVRYYRDPYDVDRLCGKCGVNMMEHGWVDTIEGGHIVCPGDYIITGVENEVYPCKPSIFQATYEPVSEDVWAGGCYAQP